MYRKNFGELSPEYGDKLFEISKEFMDMGDYKLANEGF